MPAIAVSVPIAVEVVPIVGEAATTAAASTTATATATEASASTAAASTRTGTAATSATATTTRAAFFGNVHADGAAIELLPVHLLHRGLGRFPIAERHEAEATRASRLSVGDHLGFDDFAKRHERVT